MKAKAVQILLLVLLLAGGAAGIYWQQGGDLTALTDPITALVFGEPPEPPKPAVTAPKPAIPPIPNQPVKGLLRSNTFTVQAVELQGGMLTFRQDAPPMEVKVQLDASPWEVPAGKNYQFVKPAAASTTPVVRLRWIDKDAPQEKQFADKYTLRVELGKEQDRKVPGKIYLLLPDEHGSTLVGAFTAEVRGFRLVDGKPDLTSDSVDTLQYLALRELLKDDPDKAVKDVSFRRSQLDDAVPGQAPTGYLEMVYRLGDAPALMTQKLQFVKQDKDWALRGLLKPHELHEAHPLKAPTAKDAPEQLFPYLAAQRLEAPLAKQKTPPLVTTGKFTTRYSEAHKIGVAEVSYQAGEGQPAAKTFLYQREKNGWALKRELAANERLNLATGKIEKLKPEKK